MKNNNIILILLICLPSICFSQKLVDKQEDIYKTMLFNDGILQYSCTSGLRSSQSSVSYIENNSLKWKTDFDFKGIPPVDTYGGMNLSLTSENSSVTYCALRFNDTKKFRIFTVDQSGKQNFHDFEEDKIFPFKGKVYWTYFYNSFIANDKLYILFEFYDNKKEDKKYYITEIDRDFKCRTKELEDSYVKVSDAMGGKQSKIRPITVNDKYFIYYSVNNIEKEYIMKIRYFDLSNFSNLKNYEINIPEIENISLPQLYCNSSVNYSQNINSLKPIYETKSSTNAAGNFITSYLIDLAYYFHFYYFENQIYFFGQTTINNEKGIFIYTIKLDNNSEKTAEPAFYSYASLSKKIGTKEFDPLMFEFDPHSSSIVFQVIETDSDKKNKIIDFKYYKLNETEFVEVKNLGKKFIPNVYLSLHQTYLEKDAQKTCPETDPETVYNSDYLNNSNDLRINHSSFQFYEGKEKVVMLYTLQGASNVPGREKYTKYLYLFEKN